MKNSIVCQSEVRTIHNSGERVVVAVVELVALRCHASMSHDDIRILAQLQVNIVSGKRALVNGKLASRVIREAGCVSSALLAFLREHTQDFLALLCVESVVVVD